MRPPELDLVPSAEARLLRTVGTMTDAQAGEPSRLPGWTRAVLVTHIARNASSNAAMVAAALRGEVRAQYPGGPDERAAQIEAGRGRAAAEVLADLQSAAAEWAAVMRTVADDQWDLTVHAGVGPRPVSQRAGSRLLEVEVHHADLDLGYGYGDWPPEFARPALDHNVARVGATLSGSGDDLVVTYGDGAVTGTAAALLAWLLGRESVSSAGLVVTGDPAVTALPESHPFG